VQTKTKISLIIVLLILALAGFFRFALIRSLPGGLALKEAASGLDAQNLLKGEPRSQENQGLYSYLLALSLKVFGVGIWQIKIVSGLVSMITLIGLYLLTKLLYRRTVAFFACLFAAVSIPYTILARAAFRPILIPATSVFFLYFAIKALKNNKNRYFYAFLAGVLLALGFYDQICLSFLISFLVLALIIIAEIFTRFLRSNSATEGKRRIKSETTFIKLHSKKILTALIAFAILITPLAVSLGQNPKTLWVRAENNSVFNPDLAHGPFYYLAKNLGRILTMFNVSGDTNWRNNLAGAPFFNPVIGILFLVGILVCIFPFFKKENISRKTLAKNILLLSWLLIMLIPLLLTDKESSDFLIATNLIPLVFILPALGLRALLLKARYYPIITSFLILVIVVFVANHNLWIYFKVAKNAPGYYNAYNGDLTATVLYINQNNNKKNTFLVLDSENNQIVRFLTSDQNNPYRLVAPKKADKSLYPERAKIIFPSPAFDQVEAFKKTHPQAKLIYEEYNRFGGKGLEVYQF